MTFKEQLIWGGAIALAIIAIALFFIQSQAHAWVGQTYTECYNHVCITPKPTEKEDCDHDKGHKDKCIKPTPTISPTATPSATPSVTPPSNQGGSSNGGGATSVAIAPKCSSSDTIELPANVHVLRSGTDATVMFFITEGDSANIYVKKTGENMWITSAIRVKPNGDNFVSYTFHDLDANQGYDFGVQQVKGCSGGQLVTAVVVDGPYTQDFPFTYWEWSL